MPNWCSTRMTFFSENEQQVEKLHSILKEIEAGENRVDNGFGNMWLGNILDYFGEDWQKISCRGYITEIDEITSAGKTANFEIFLEEAWGPHIEVWEIVLKQDGFDNISFVYMAEEPGCKVYINTDEAGVFYSDRFYVDLYFDEITPETADLTPMYFETKEDCILFLNDVAKKLGSDHKFADIFEANEWFGSYLYGSGDYCVAYEFSDCYANLFIPYWV